MSDHVNPAILVGEAVAKPSEGDIAAACQRILICGEDNPQSTRPEHALVPWPDGCAGHRLMRILGLPEAVYLSIPRTNLCCPTWDLRAARSRVLDLLELAAPGSLIIALGAKVRDAFNHPWRDQLPPSKFFTSSDHGGDPGTPHHFKIAYLPHPSGRNQIWNSPEPALRARLLLQTLAPDVPWGTA